jgi:hypothetical protein
MIPPVAPRARRGAPCRMASNSDRSAVHPASVRFDDGTEAIVRTLSASGMCVDTSSSVALGDSLTFELRPPAPSSLTSPRERWSPWKRRSKACARPSASHDLQLRDAT